LFKPIFNTAKLYLVAEKDVALMAARFGTTRTLLCGG
jgi:hypothetical protein